MALVTLLKAATPQIVARPAKTALRKLGKFFLGVAGGPEGGPPAIHVTPDGFVKLRPDISARLHQTPVMFGVESACLLQYYRGGVHLDIGCGSRKITAVAIGVDLGSDEQYFVADSVNVKTPAHKLGVFSDGSVSFITAMHSFEHYDNPVEVLTEWHRVLKVGGRIGIVVPHRHGLIPEKEKFGGDHKFDYDADSLRRLVESLGLRFRILALDSLQNGFSIDLVLEKE